MKPTQTTALERVLQKQLQDIQEQNAKIQNGISRKSAGMGFSPEQRNQAIQAAQAEMQSRIAAGQSPAQAAAAVQAGQSAMVSPSAAQAPYPVRPQWWMAPGNVGDINTVIWDYFFVTQPAIVAPGSSSTQIININNVASFTLKDIIKTAFVVEAPAPAISLKYLDPDAPADLGFAKGVTVQIQDVSSAQKYSQGPINLDHIGSPTNPFTLPAPLMLQPSASISVQISNTDPSTSYQVQIALLGYRLRINNQGQLGSQVTYG